MTVGVGSGTPHPAPRTSGERANVPGDQDPQGLTTIASWGKADFPLTGKLQANINGARNADSRAKAAIPAF